MNPDETAPNKETAPRCQPVKGERAKCCVCRLELLCADFDHDLRDRACVECAELLRGAQVRLHDNCRCIPPPDDCGPFGPRPQLSPILV